MKKILFIKKIKNITGILEAGFSGNRHLILKSKHKCK
jgi:hypothetical protein